MSGDFLSFIYYKQNFVYAVLLLCVALLSCGENMTEVKCATYARREKSRAWEYVPVFRPPSPPPVS